MKANTVLETIGNTPHIRLARLFPDAEVWVKSERANPGGSIKDRIALAMIEAAEASGALSAGWARSSSRPPVTPASGLAMVAAVKGYKLILVMPDSMSIERRRVMQAYGATFDLTPREKGMKGAIARATELAAEHAGAWIPQQFENPANIDVHARTTAQEILADFPGGVHALDHRGRHRRPHHRLCGGAEDALARPARLRGRAESVAGDFRRRAPAPHPIQGIGAGFIPTNLHTDVLDGTIQVEAEEAREYARRSARQEGLLVGISSGATLAAIARKLPDLPAGRDGARF